MDFEDRQDDQEGLPKWPFLASALFILLGALGFAYYHYHFSGELEVWQLLVCILASGTASVLIFMPFLLERSLQLCLLTANRKDDELFRKVYFDLKEVGNELEALAVKVDKVPTLVDKIVSDSTKDLSQLNQLSSELSETKEELVLKLGHLEELATREPPTPAPDPGIANANKAIVGLVQSLENLTLQLSDIQSRIEQIPTKFPAPVLQALPSDNQPPSMVKETKEQQEENPETEETVEEIISEEAFSSDSSESDEIDEVIEKLVDQTEEEEKPTPEQPESDTEGEEQVPLNDKEDENDHDPQGLSEDDHAEQLFDSDVDLTEPKLEEETFDDLVLAEPEEVESEDELEPGLSSGTPDEENSSPLEIPEEMDLGLPDPEETLRKVDALLAGESTKPPPAEIEEEKTKKASGGMTTVIAKVMIGIGNKPFVRGEGPGLNWDEGVPMNFLEIGKWAWSPPRKNASLTIQIYRNDEDPDQSGKHKINAGEKFEITPEFG